MAASNNLQTLSLVTANLAAGLNPRLRAAPSPGTADPGIASGGYDVRDSIVATVEAALREHPLRRTCYYAVDTADLAATYTVEIDGNDDTYDAGASGAASLADVLAGVAAAALGLAGVVSAEPYDMDGDGVDDAVRIVQADGAGLSFDGSATGTAVVSLYADAESATLSVLVRPAVSGIASSLAAGAEALRVRGWRALYTDAGKVEHALDAAGASIIVDVRPFAAAYPALSSVQGVAGDGVTVVSLARSWVLPCEAQSVV